MERDDTTDVVMDLEVGGDAVTNFSDEGGSLSTWLSKLKKNITTQQHLQRHDREVENAGANDTITSLPNVSRVLMMHNRDEGQRQLAASLEQFTRQVKPSSSSSSGGVGGSAPHWEPALSGYELENLSALIRKMTEHSAVPLQKFYQLQEDLTAQTAKSQSLHQQWKDNVPADVPKENRLVLDSMLDSMRAAHTEWLSLIHDYTEKSWKLRADLVEAYRVLVHDTVREFDQEGRRIVNIFQEVRGELDKQIAVAENNDFNHHFHRTLENFKFWVNSLASVLPQSLKLQQHVDTFLSDCEGAEADPCCLKRVTHLRDQLARIESAAYTSRKTSLFNLCTIALPLGKIDR